MNPPQTAGLAERERLAKECDQLRSLNTELLDCLKACEDRLCREGSQKAWAEIELARNLITRAES